MMQITITGRRVEITGALRNYAEQKLKKLFRYSFKPMTANIRLSVEKYRRLAEIILWVNGSRILAKEETDEMYQSIDLAIEKIEQRLRKYKEKRSSHKPSSNNRLLSPKPTKKTRLITRQPYIVSTLSMPDALAIMTAKRTDGLVFFDDADEKLKLLTRGNSGHFEMTELIIE